jgi:hypothetical protein
MRQHEQENRRTFGEDDFSKDFFSQPTPFDTHKFDNDMVGVEHSYDWKSKSFNHRTDTDMTSNKRYEIQEGFQKKPSSSIPDSVASEYFKNEEAIMK